MADIRVSMNIRDDAHSTGNMVVRQVCLPPGVSNHKAGIAEISVLQELRQLRLAIANSAQVRDRLCEPRR
jgi:hypothetical protein